MDGVVLARVRQSNPWLFGGPAPGTSKPSAPPEPWIPRTQVRGPDLLEPGRAPLLVGPRQAGKSSLAWSGLRETTVGVQR